MISEFLKSRLLLGGLTSHVSVCSGVVQVFAVSGEDTGIRFSNKGGREFDHFVLVPKDTKMWFFKEIEKYVLVLL